MEAVALLGPTRQSTRLAAANLLRTCEMAEGLLTIDTPRLAQGLDDLREDTGRTVHFSKDSDFEKSDFVFHFKRQ